MNAFGSSLNSIPVASLAGTVVCWILLRVASRVARHIGLVDHPRGRKQHSQPTPLVGGIAMSIGFLVAVLLLDYGLTPYRFLFAGITVVIVIGVLDDMHELAPESRLWAQVFAALLMVGGGSVVLEDLGFLLSSDGLLLTGMLAWPITVFASVGVINALNMSDGLDGLAAAITLVVLACLAAFAWAAGDYRILGLVAILAAVVAPFLALNLRPDRPALVFMGDAGSMFLGFVLAWLLVQASQGEQRIMAPVTALWLFALPLLDTVSTLIRRLLLGRSPFLGDREHIHHLLLAAGLTEKQTLTVLVAFASVAAGCGLAGHFLAIPEPWMFSAFLALFGLYLWGTMRAWGRGRLLGRKLPVCSQPVAPQTVATQRE